MAGIHTPELVPVLSRGKHRSPDKGACFMEYASYLAGERWTDHPSCTHPLLARLARGVNDQISDEGRARLVPLIPSVVGLKSDDPMSDVGIAVRSASIALPVAARDRQRALAAGILAAERILHRTHPKGSATVDTNSLFEHAYSALSSTPDAARWAAEFIGDVNLRPKTFRRRSAPNMVRLAVLGIAEACITDRDALLHELLTTVTHDCSQWMAAGTRRAGAMPSRTHLAQSTR